MLIRWITCLIIKDVLCLKVMLPGLDKDYRRARAELYRLVGVNFP
ncbi:ketodeoxygluconokinase [Escherichia coli]|uniref:Ketodeoxygluconokinase n=1 Tax=Escherichia coli TaxID=562 RepID=A0A0H0FUS0_ECOLX|nr:ketodeoxygluconokinase [Escherichia coli]KLG55157.1 ketodeoxygluconokinase [Escherichia coli]KNF63089.1 ketodeoxygluconokinase [Escherichia coli]